MRPRMLFERRPMSASSGKAEVAKNWVSKSFNRKTLKSAFDPGISRFDPCSRQQISVFAPETRKKPNEAAHSHVSRSRLQNERRHAQIKAKNLSVPKRNKSDRGTQRRHLQTRGTVRDTRAYATASSSGSRTLS